MKVSIITVCYNSESSILAAIQSVANQTYENIEYIIVDGGSQDSTLALIKSHGARVSKLISEPDEGIYDAMNKGLAYAKGDLVAFLNSDDEYMDCTIIERVVDIMSKGDFDCLAGDVIFFRSENPSNIVRKYSSKRFSPKRIAWGWMPAQPALFFRKNVYDGVGLFTKEYKIAGDFDFIVRAFTGHPIKYCYVPKVLVRMRLGGISTAGWKSTVLLNKEMMHACRSNGVVTNWFKLLSRYPFKILEYLFTN